MKKANYQQWSGVTTYWISSPAYNPNYNDKINATIVSSDNVLSQLEKVIEEKRGALLYVPGHDSQLLGVMDYGNLYLEDGKPFFETNNKNQKMVRYQSGSLAASNFESRLLPELASGSQFDHSTQIFGVYATEIATLNSVPLGSGMYSIIGGGMELPAAVRDIFTRHGFGVLVQPGTGDVITDFLRAPTAIPLLTSAALGMASFLVCVQQAVRLLKHRLKIIVLLGGNSRICANLTLGHYVTSIALGLAAGTIALLVVIWPLGREDFLTGCLVPLTFAFSSFLVISGILYLLLARLAGQINKWMIS